MPDFAVSTVFKAKDQVSATLGRMTKRVNRFGLQSTQAFNRASRSGSLFGKIVKGILVAGVVRRGIGLLASGLREATEQFISFDDSIKSATARFGDLKVGTIAGQKSIADLRKISRKLGAETEFTATEAARGLEFFALAGLSVKESIALLPGTVDLATAANVDLARAVEIGVKSLGAFGIESKNTVELQKNFIRVTDLLAKTSTSAVLDFDTLFESIRTGASIFSDAGQSMETFAALVGKMAKTGVDGEKAGTALRNVMLKLAAPTDEAGIALSSLGVKVANQKGEFRDLIDVIADFEKGMKKVSEVERLAALDVIFGKKAITGFNAVLKFGSKGLRNYRSDLKDAAGASRLMAEIMRKSLGKRLAALKSAAIEVGFKFLDAFKVRGEGAIEAATSALRNFDVTPVTEAVNGTIDIFKELFKTISPITTAISTLNKSDVVGLLKIAAAIKSIAIATRLLNTVLTASPAGLLLTGVAATAAGLSFLQKKLGLESPRLTILEEMRFDKERKKRELAPNREDITRLQQHIFGRIDLAGAPEGTTFEFSKAPGIDANVLGANP